MFLENVGERLNKLWGLRLYSRDLYCNSRCIHAQGRQRLVLRCFISCGFGMSFWLCKVFTIVHAATEKKNHYFSPCYSFWFVCSHMQLIYVVCPALKLSNLQQGSSPSPSLVLAIVFFFFITIRVQRAL